MYKDNELNFLSYFKLLKKNSAKDSYDKVILEYIEENSFILSFNQESFDDFKLNFYSWYIDKYSDELLNDILFIDSFDDLIEQYYLIIEEQVKRIDTTNKYITLLLEEPQIYLFYSELFGIEIIVK